MWQNSHQWTLDYVTFISTQLNYYNSIGTAIMIHADCSPAFIPRADITPERVAMWSLASYYIVSTENTYFDYQDSTHYSRPRDDWFDAINYDIGVPISDWYILQSWVDYGNSTPSNLLSNSNFEFLINNGSSAANWTCNNRVICTISNDSISGSHSIMITTNSTSYSGGIYQFFPMKQFTNYTLSVWVKVVNTSGQIPFINTIIARSQAYVGPTGTSVSISVSDGLVGEWFRVLGRFTTSSNTTGSYVYCGQILNTIGSILFDDCQLTEGWFYLDRIFARNFTKSFVLMRPLDTPKDHYSDDTAITLNLGEDFYPLKYDGSLGNVTTTVTLRNFDGAVLLRPVIPTTGQVTSGSLSTAAISTGLVTTAGSSTTTRTITTDYSVTTNSVTTSFSSSTYGMTTSSEESAESGYIGLAPFPCFCCVVFLVI